jgi:DNA-binding GntR family transcriptional regulator
MPQNGSSARQTGAPAGRAARVLPSVDTIHQRVLTAIVEHRLPPGTKLGEERLAKVFGVSRTQIRQVIERLSHDSIVTVQPNRGAFVSSPTVDEAREVFAARRLIEPDLIRQAIRRAGPSEIRRLRDHVRSESDAREANDKRAVVRAVGRVPPAHRRHGRQPLPGASTTARARKRSPALVIILYDAPNMPACPYDDHSDLVDAIEAARRGARSRASWCEHLRHVEGSVRLRRLPSDGEIDFEVDLRLTDRSPAHAPARRQRQHVRHS